MKKQKNNDREPVNFIHQFLLSMEKISETPEMNPTHVSLYISLFALWNLNQFRNPISINRREVMSISRIGSKHTYHKCLRDLHRLNFLNYSPSHNPMKGSLISLCILKANPENPEIKSAGRIGTTSGTTAELVVAQQGGKSGTTSEQVLHPSLNNINYINNKHIYKDENFEIKNGKRKSGTHSGAEVQDTCKAAHSKNKSFAPPSKEELIAFFLEEVKKHEIPARFAPVEAEKFMNYYTAKGWRIGNKSAMKDWRASARNWLLNFLQFNKILEKPAHSQAGHLHADENKRYDIPL